MQQKYLCICLSGQESSMIAQKSFSDS